jgi:uncharacterized membrane protein
MESIKLFIEWSALGIELGTIALILVATVFGTVRFVYHVTQNVADAYKQYKVHLGQMLMLALELLVAADIIRTVALDQTLNNVLTLALLVVVRTFLSWSLSVEVEGRLPWKGGQEQEEIKK